MKRYFLISYIAHPATIAPIMGLNGAITENGKFINAKTEANRITNLYLKSHRIEIKTVIFTQLLELKEPEYLEWTRN